MSETDKSDRDSSYEADERDGFRVNPKSPREAIQPEPAPPPPARSRHVRNPVVVFVNFLLTVAVLGVIAVGGALYWGKAEFDKPGPLSEKKTVIIASGSGLNSIASTLEANGVIDDELVFKAGVWIYKNAGKLKAGEYAFNAGVSMQEVMSDLVSGNAVYHSVTIPEGWTSAQIVERLREDPVLVGEIEELPEEGSLLPETYSFTRGTTRQQILNQMQRAQTKALTEIWERRSDDLPIESPEELVILASIVEKETGRADERPRVAGVFANRLKRGMRLQSDPTILYGLHGGEAWKEDRSAIKQSELQAENPYNTYQIQGLPPGPIGNPGRAAMEAVASPSRTKDLYFVADGTGGHAFAETYEQHQRNVRRWRDVEREKRAQEAEAEAQSGNGNGNGEGADAQQ